MNILGKAPYFSYMSFHILSHSFIFFHFPSFSFIFLHFLSFSFFVFFPFFFSSCSFFSGAQNPLFLPRLPHDFLLKLVSQKSFFLVPSREVNPFGPSFFSRLFFFHFRFLFQFLFHVFPFFSFVYPCFHVFLLFSFKNVSSFFMFSLFFFSRVPKICGGTPGFLGEKCMF